ncbi:MAG: DUF2853 family protein [bacterium]|nr:DUF2853 family protein [bacterium]
MTDYVDDIKKYAKKLNEDAVASIVEHCSITPLSKNSSLVSCLQKSELGRVRDSFCKKKLELSDSDDKIDGAIDAVCEKMGRSYPNKSRVTFYYLLAENHGKQGVFSNKGS